MTVSLVKHTLKLDAFGDSYKLHKKYHCRHCGSNNVTMGYIPGMAIGSVWVEGIPFSDCLYCGKRSFVDPCPIS